LVCGIYISRDLDEVVVYGGQISQKRLMKVSDAKIYLLLRRSMQKMKPNRIGHFGLRR